MVFVAWKLPILEWLGKQKEEEINKDAGTTEAKHFIAFHKFST